MYIICNDNLIKLISNQTSNKIETENYFYPQNSFCRIFENVLFCFTEKSFVVTHVHTQKNGPVQ